MRSKITSYISSHSYCATFKIENTKGEITLAPLLWNNAQMYLLYECFSSPQLGMTVFCRVNPLMLPNLILTWRFLNKSFLAVWSRAKGSTLWLLSESCCMTWETDGIRPILLLKALISSLMLFSLICSAFWAHFFLFASLYVSLSFFLSLLCLSFWGQHSLVQESVPV